jgi:2-hydroxy-6-oxonona-2,4-dienedioate hydrolase
MQAGQRNPLSTGPTKLAYAPRRIGYSPAFQGTKPMNVVSTRPIDVAAPHMPPAKWIDVAGVRTCYFDAGKGDPVVFVYGGNFGGMDSASSAPVWNLNFGPLSAAFRCIAFDKIGQGYTDNPLRDEDYTMAAVVDHAANFIRALNLPPVHLVGHSRGGFACTSLTLRYPDLVRSLTIVNSGTLMPTFNMNEAVLTPCPFPSYSREAARFVYEGYSYAKETVTDEWIDTVMAVLSLEKSRASARKMVDEKLKTRVFLPQLALHKRETLNLIKEGLLRRPVQIFWGYNDPTSRVDGGLELFKLVAQHNRRTFLHVINEAGHFVYREQPEQFNASLARFVTMSAQAA